MREDLSVLSETHCSDLLSQTIAIQTKMFKLVVLSALVAVSMSAPSNLLAPVAYSVGSIPTSISSQSSSVVHDARPVLAAPAYLQSPVVEVKSVPAYVQSPIVEVKAAPAIVGSVPTSVSSYSSAIVHDAKAVVAAPAPVQIVETAPVVEVKSAAVYQSAPLVSQASVISVPTSISSQSSSVVHDARAVVAAPQVQYVQQYAAAPIAHYSAPLAHYAAGPVQYAGPIATQYAAAPVAQYAAGPVAYSSYPSGLIAGPIVKGW